MTAANGVRFDFGGARVLVTGGTSGIGHEVARSFRAAGATVDVTGTRSSAEDYDTDLTGLGYHRLVLGDAASVARLAASYDRLDVLVNNAGATFPGGRDEWEPEGFEDALVLNLAGHQRLTLGLRDALRASELAGGASVVNLASLSAFRAVPMVPGYGSAKAGLLQLTRNLAVLWAGDGIRVNAVAPGVIDTPMTQPMHAMPSLVAEQVSRIPLGRLGTVAEVAGAVLFLCAGCASYVTGTTVVVDGGALAD